MILYSKFNFLIIFLLFFVGNKMISQVIPTMSCNQSTININTILPPNSVTTLTTFGVVNVFYLCGPNTVLYDTIPINPNGSCRYVLLEAGSKFVTKTIGCLLFDIIYAKNSSTVIIQPGVNPSTRLIFEPLATIIDQVGLTNTISCTSISFPIVNCGVTSISESNALDSQFEIYPNPANDRLNLKFISNEKEFYKAQILNSTGKVVKEIDLYSNVQISIEDLPNGIYILNCKNLESLTVNKRFVIAR